MIDENTADLVHTSGEKRVSHVSAAGTFHTDERGVMTVPAFLAERLIASRQWRRYEPPTVTRRKTKRVEEAE